MYPQWDIAHHWIGVSLGSTASIQHGNDLSCLSVNNKNQDKGKNVTSTKSVCGVSVIHFTDGTFGIVASNNANTTNIKPLHAGIAQPQSSGGFLIGTRYCRHRFHCYFVDNSVTEYRCSLISPPRSFRTRRQAMGRPQSPSST